MAADEAGQQEGQARIYGPRRCGSDGGTECPYVVLERLEPTEVRSLVALRALGGPRQ